MEKSDHNLESRESPPPYPGSTGGQSVNNEDEYDTPSSECITPADQSTSQASSSQNPVTTPAKKNGISELSLISAARSSWGLGNMTHRSSEDIFLHAYTTSPAVFCLQPSDFLRRESLLLLRSGPGKAGTVLGTCESLGLKANDFIVKVDTDGNEKLETKDTPEIFTWTIASGLPALKGEPPSYDPTRKRSFVWKRFAKTDNKASSFISPDWKLIDQDTLEVHCVFVEIPGAAKERGELQCRRSFGYSWELGVLVTLGIVVECERQRHNKRGDFTKGFLSSSGIF